MSEAVFEAVLTGTIWGHRTDLSGKRRRRLFFSGTRVKVRCAVGGLPSVSLSDGYVAAGIVGKNAWFRVLSPLELLAEAAG